MIRRLLLGYLKARCTVSSQHKLPGEQEILDCAWASFFDREELKKTLRDLTDEGVIFCYGGCYYSDHEIDVM